MSTEEGRANGDGSAASSSSIESRRHSTSSVDSISSVPTSPASLPSSLKPCGPSILKNPIPPNEQKKKKRKPSIVITHLPSSPPPHFVPLAASPPPPPTSQQQQSSSNLHDDRSSDDTSRTATASQTSWASSFLLGQQDGDKAAPTITRERGRSVDAKLVHGPEEHSGKSLKFAPLPPGRSLYRSNSITIGVAARAQMIQSQGGGSSAKTAPRYAGPMWHEYGGVPPPDIYTYKDLQKGVSKLWKKVRRRSNSDANVTTGQAAVDEKMGPKKQEIEHIEEVDENQHLEDADDDSSAEFVEAPEAPRMVEQDEDRGRTRHRLDDEIDRPTTAAAAYEPHV